MWRAICLCQSKNLILFQNGIDFNNNGFEDLCFGWFIQSLTLFYPLPRASTTRVSNAIFAYRLICWYMHNECWPTIICCYRQINGSEPANTSFCINREMKPKMKKEKAQGRYCKRKRTFLRIDVRLIQREWIGKNRVEFVSRIVQMG